MEDEQESELIWSHSLGRYVDRYSLSDHEIRDNKARSAGYDGACPECGEPWFGTQWGTQCPECGHKE